MRNGSFPEAPVGGHNSQVGTLLDAVPVALPGEPPELVEEGGRGAPADVLVVPPPEADPVAALPAVEPPVVVPVAVEDAGCAAVEVVFVPAVAAVAAVALLPSVTTPPFVTLYEFAVVWAKAEAMAAKSRNAALTNVIVIMQRPSRHHRSVNRAGGIAFAPGFGCDARLLTIFAPNWS